MVQEVGGNKGGNKGSERHIAQGGPRELSMLSLDEKMKWGGGTRQKFSCTEKAEEWRDKTQQWV